MARYVLSNMRSAPILRLKMGRPLLTKATFMGTVPADMPQMVRLAQEFAADHRKESPKPRSVRVKAGG